MVALVSYEVGGGGLSVIVRLILTTALCLRGTSVEWKASKI